MGPRTGNAGGDHRRLQTAGVVLILLVHFLLLLGVAREKSATVDEPYHIARGVSALFSGDFRMSVSHPPLINVISAMPLLFMRGLKIPFADPYWQSRSVPEGERKRRFARALLWIHDRPYWEGNRNPLQIIFWARVPIMALSLALGLLVFVWTRSLWGVPAGFTALVLYAFSPTILAHGCLATTDLGAALTIFLFAFVLWRHLLAPGWKSLLFAGFCLGLALLAKFTGILLCCLTGPALLAALPPGGRIRKFFSLRADDGLRYRGALAWAVMVLAGGLTVWAGYGFEVNSLYDVRFIPLTNQGVELWLKQAAVNLVAAVPVPPRTYYFGLAKTLLETHTLERPVYFAGRLSPHGFWYYYPVLFLMKEPLVVVGLVVAGLVVGRRRPELRLRGETAAIVVVFSVGILLAFMLLNRRNIGLRYILPVYPFLFLWLGSLAEAGRRMKLAGPALAALLALYAGNALHAYPDYLVHFNSLVGGTDGGLHYSVEGEDWGQDLTALSEFCRRNRIDKIRYLARGTSDPAAYGVPVEEWRCAPGDSGWFAISINELQLHSADLKECSELFESLKPVAVLHHTICVYKLPERTTPKNQISVIP